MTHSGGADMVHDESPDAETEWEILALLLSACPPLPRSGRHDGHRTDNRQSSTGEAFN